MCLPGSIFPDKNINSLIESNFCIFENCKIFQFDLCNIQCKHPPVKFSFEYCNMINGFEKLSLQSFFLGFIVFLFVPDTYCFMTPNVSNYILSHFLLNSKIFKNLVSISDSISLFKIKDIITIRKKAPT